MSLTDSTTLYLDGAFVSPSELDDLMQTGIELQKRVALLEKENTRLRKGAPTTASGAITRDVALREQVRRLEEENAALRGRSDPSELGLADRLRRASDKNRELRAEANGLRAQVRGMGVLMQQVGELEASNEMLRRQLNAATATDEEAVRQQLMAAWAEIARLEAANAEQVAQIDRLERQLQDTDTDRDAEELNAARERAQQLQQRLDDMVRVIAEQQTQIERRDADIATMEGEITELGMELEGARGEIDADNERIASLDREVTRLERKYQREKRRYLEARGPDASMALVTPDYTFYVAAFVDSTVKIEAVVKEETAAYEDLQKAQAEFDVGGARRMGAARKRLVTATEAVKQALEKHADLLFGAETYAGQPGSSRLMGTNIQFYKDRVEEILATRKVSDKIKITAAMTGEGLVSGQDYEMASQVYLAAQQQEDALTGAEDEETRTAVYEATDAAWQAYLEASAGIGI